MHLKGIETTMVDKNIEKRLKTHTTGDFSTFTIPRTALAVVSALERAGAEALVLKIIENFVVDAFDLFPVEDIIRDPLAIIHERRGRINSRLHRIDIHWIAALHVAR